MEGSEKMIREVIEAQCCVTSEQLDANPKLIDLGCDDLDFVEIIMTIEDLADRDIDDAKMGDMEQTVSEFVRSITAQIGKWSI